MLKLIPGITYSHQKKVICLDIDRILRFFWPIAKAGTQIREKKTTHHHLGFRGEADKADKAVSEILLPAPMQIQTWAKAAQLQHKYCFCRLK